MSVPAEKRHSAQRNSNRGRHNDENDKNIRYVTADGKRYKITPKDSSPRSPDSNRVSYPARRNANSPTYSNGESSYDRSQPGTYRKSNTGHHENRSPTSTYSENLSGNARQPESNEKMRQSFNVNKASTPKDSYRNDPHSRINTQDIDKNINQEDSWNQSFDRKLSNSIAILELNQSGSYLDRSLDRSFERRLSNSIAIPGLFPPEGRSKSPTKSPQKSPTKSSQKIPVKSAHKTSTETPKPVSKTNDTDMYSNLDETGEKARLLSVRRLDSPRPRGHRSDQSESSSTISDLSDAPDVFLPKRYILALMMFLGFVNMYAIRVNLNVAIGAMVNNHTFVKDGVASVEPPEFDWSSRLQGVILGSFYYGYMVLQIPGGYFAMRYGGTKIFGGAILIASILTILTPFATRLSVWALVVLRVLEGLVLGVMLPCNHQIWSLWAPLQERTTLVTIALSGMNVGTVVTMPLTGLLTKYGFDGGWASVFYCFGVFGIIWGILWMYIVDASPASHPTISQRERHYIMKNVTVRKSMSIPWKAIFTSRPVWAVIIGNVANDWGLYTILICLPLFLMDIMKFNVQTMGFIASLPFLLKAMIGPIGGVIADILRYKYTTTANVRRIFYAIGAMSAAVMIVIAGYSHTPTMAIFSMCVGVALSGLLHSGYEVNVLDIAPCLSGIVMGISNTAGTTTGFLSPLLVGIMTENKKRSEWQTVFWITFLIYAVGTVLFCWLLSGETQHWAEDQDDDDDQNHKRREK